MPVIRSGPAMRSKPRHGRYPRARARSRTSILSLAFLLLPAREGLPQESSGLEDEVRGHVEGLKAALINSQRSDGSWVESGYSTGMTALAVLALKQAGLPNDHPAVEKGVYHIVKNFEGKVYSESLVICALELVGPGIHRRRIEESLRFLLGTQGATGGWSYEDRRVTYDNSNTQFAVLGLAAAERCGIAVPKTAKQRALDHWLRTKSADDGWAYQGPAGGSSLSMTCAGIASLYLLGRVYEKPAGKCGDYQYDSVLQKGLKRMLLHIAGQRNAVGRNGAWGPYTLYALERVGMFLDLKDVDGLDWYRWGAGQVLRGGGSGSTADLAFDLLFLAKGEAQVAVAKWRWQGDWNDDHLDLKSWMSLGSEELKLKLDWIPAQLDQADTPASKASMIFVNGHDRFTGGDRDALFLREYLARRGTLIAEGCCGRQAFIDSFEEFLRSRLYPMTPLQFVPVSAGHPVTRQKYALEPEEVSALEVKTGCQRRRILIFTRDFSCALNGEPSSAEVRDRSRKLGINLLQWAMRARAPRGKLSEVEPVGKADSGARPGEEDLPIEPAGATRKLRQPFGRLIHRGEWDADPSFFPTLREAIASVEGIPRLDGEVFVNPASEDLFASSLLFVTGHGDPRLTREEWLPLRTFLEAGGTIVATACCGFEEFDAGLRRLLANVLPNDRLEEIPEGSALWKTPHPLRDLPVDASKAFLAKHGKGLAPLYGIRREGRWIVIYSPVDLCCDLEGDLDEGEAIAYKKATSIPIWLNILNYVFTP